MTGISEEGVLKKLLQHMNSQVPSRRTYLSELLRMEDPHYTAGDGRDYSIDRGELDFLREVLLSLGMTDIKLPIVLMGDASQSQSAWRVDGREECAVISSVLERPLEEGREKLFLYAPHLAALRRRLPTTTACMYLP